jgi:pimeloyl-ACP methyl ester carboxylesterase
MVRTARGLLLLVISALQLPAAVPRIREHPCPQGLRNARCGFIEVPEDRSARGSRTIHIEFVQVRANTSHPESDAWIDVAGGPGVPSTPAAPFMAQVFGYVLKHRDLVFYDQRGAGASSFLHCDLRQTDKPEEKGDFLPASAVRHCHQQIASHADPAQYNTAASVSDLEDLRAALGYQQLTLHALSYGTRLSQAYMAAYPAHIRAAIFEGVLQPGARIPLNFARDMQHSLEGVLDDCRRDPGCRPIADAIDLQRIAATGHFTFPVAGNPVQLTPAQLFEDLRVLLYDAQSARRLPLILRELSRGETASLPAVWETAHKDDPRYSWPLWLSITCAEDTPWIQENEIASATEGTVLQDYRIRQQQRACQEWPVPKRAVAAAKPARAPVLLMAGQLDPVTPPWNKSELSKYFSHGRQIVIPHAGHMLIGLAGIECVDTIEEQFLEKLDPDALDTTCVGKIQRNPFIVAQRGDMK